MRCAILNGNKITNTCTYAQTYKHLHRFNSKSKLFIFVLVHVYLFMYICTYVCMIMCVCFFLRSFFSQLTFAGCWHPTTVSYFINVNRLLLLRLTLICCCCCCSSCFFLEFSLFCCWRWLRSAMSTLDTMTDRLLTSCRVLTRWISTYVEMYVHIFFVVVLFMCVQLTPTQRHDRQLQLQLFY